MASGYHNKMVRFYFFLMIMIVGGRICVDSKVRNAHRSCDLNIERHRKKTVQEGGHICHISFTCTVTQWRVETFYELNVCAVGFRIRLRCNLLTFIVVKLRLRQPGLQLHSNV